MTTAHTVVDVAADAIPPIGRAIHAGRTLLLGADLRPVQTGTEGKILVAVPGRSGRWYQTGDLTVSESGVLTFRGRPDLEQLKDRGVRIEAALMACPGVDVAAATMLGAGADGVLVTTARPSVLAQLRAFRTARLPTAAIPNRFVFVNRYRPTATATARSTVGWSCSPRRRQNPTRPNRRECGA